MADIDFSDLSEEKEQFVEELNRILIYNLEVNIEEVKRMLGATE